MELTKIKRIPSIHIYRMSLSKIWKIHVSRQYFQTAFFSRLYKNHASLHWNGWHFKFFLRAFSNFFPPDNLRRYRQRSVPTVPSRVLYSTHICKKYSSAVFFDGCLYSETTWAVGIVQLSHHEVQGGGKSRDRNGYPNKVWDKSKTTWAVGIAQLTHQEVQCGGKNPDTEGRRIFVPTADRVVS